MLCDVRVVEHRVQWAMAYVNSQINVCTERRILTVRSTNF